MNSTDRFDAIMVIVYMFGHVHRDRFARGRIPQALLQCAA